MSEIDRVRGQFKRLSGLAKDLRSSADARSLLFATGVLLVEGDTEIGALPVWWYGVSGKPLDAQNLAIFGVGGEKGFERWMRYLTSMGVRWAVLCDGKIIGDAPDRCGIAEQIDSAGISAMVPVSASDDFKTRRSTLADFGIFTFANAADEEFEALPVIQQNSKTAERHVGKSKARVGRWIAENCERPGDVEVVLKRAIQHIAR